MEIIVIIAVIAIIVVFIFKMNKNKKLTPELERFKNELEKIHEETGITDIYALAEIKRINDTKKYLMIRTTRKTTDIYKRNINMKFHLD